MNIYLYKYIADIIGGVDMKKTYVILLGLILMGSVAFGNISANAETTQEEDANLEVMSYNLRYDNPNDPQTWEERLPVLQEYLLEKDPDIIGTQEALYNQVNDVDANLPGYDWIGLGREGGSNGEFMAIYYKEDRFTPLEYDHYWLSDTPKKIGSTSWGNSIPRMVTWAKFEDKETNKQFYFVNTHFDHESENARVKSAELIAERLNDFDEDIPVVLTGDFNTPLESESHQILTADDLFEDPWETAEEKINEDLGTFNGFNDATGGGADNKIDWVLTKGIDTKSVEIDNYQNNGYFPSDHYPVITELNYLEQEEESSPVIKNLVPEENKSLKAGESVKIQLESETGLKATFSIKMPLTNVRSASTELPLLEVDEGQYVGYWTATSNVVAEGAEIQVNVVDQEGNSNSKTAEGTLDINVEK